MPPPLLFARGKRGKAKALCLNESAAPPQPHKSAGMREREGFFEGISLLVALSKGGAEFPIRFCSLTHRTFRFGRLRMELL